MIKIYLDNCCFNRPFDDQSHIRIRLETEAKLFAQAQIKTGQIQLVWSYLLDIENQQNPFHDRKHAIASWKKYAIEDIEETEDLLNCARQFLQCGIKPKDAIHVASAIQANADYFLTTDDKLLKKLTNLIEIIALNPTDFIKVIDHDIDRY